MILVRTISCYRKQQVDDRIPVMAILISVLVILPWDYGSTDPGLSHLENTEKQEQVVDT